MLAKAKTQVAKGSRKIMAKDHVIRMECERVFYTAQVCICYHMPWCGCHSVIQCAASRSRTQADDSWLKHPSPRLLLDRLVDYAREQSAAGKGDEAG